MPRVRLSVDLDPELKRRVRIAAAAQDMTVRQWIERAIAESLERAEDRGWMESDLSHLGEIEPYEFQEGEIEKGYPVYYEPGVGLVIDKSRDEQGEEHHE